jgi:ectoine hydroxylase-related dioxygenase (phytanoyl-CoA dioxygenase family)
MMHLMVVMNTATLPATLSSDQLTQYHREGYLFLRGVFTAEEVREFQAEASRLLASDLVDEKNIRTRPRKLPSGVLEVERFDPVIDVSTIFRDVITSERILGPLRDIFEEEAVLFKDKLIFKVPGMSGYTMHQDYAWWQPQGAESELPGIDPDKILSVMVGIDAADAENGAIQLFPGRHHELISTPGELRNMNDEETATLDRTTTVLGETQPGDVVIFHSLTPHCSERNNSPRSRRQLYMTYNSKSAGDVYEAQQGHYRNYTTKQGGEGLFFR